ncbi:MAG: hypothetical protein M3R24_04640 [Chloroflexota bacterium]|nr:hypothetical protein [Chloroflexota bacterium]
MDAIDQIITTLDHIESVENEDDLGRLDQALQALGQISNSERGMDALFRIYERFPESDGYGIFWNILHTLEDMPAYEQRLIESVQRQPMEFNLKMVNGLLNAGVTHQENVDLLALLESIAASPRYSDSARQHARRFVEWQRDCT